MDNIREHFNLSEKKIYRQNELSLLFTNKREEWSLPPSISLAKFVENLVAETGLQKIIFEFPHRRETRYVWGDVSEFDIILSLKKGSYLSHQTATYLHGLIEGPLENIFVNFEQSRRIQKGDLTQEAIDRAFQRPVRVTRNKCEYNDKTIWQINGMYTDKFGVIEIIGRNGEDIYVTNLARTLVDLAVRPVYGGGVSNVFSAYQKAKGKVTADELAKTLKGMGHIYPYHQVVGFYLEKAGGVEEKSLDKLREMPMSFDFYLAHQMHETAYSKKWRLHYPVELKMEIE